MSRKKKTAPIEEVLTSELDTKDLESLNNRETEDSEKDTVELDEGLEETDSVGDDSSETTSDEFDIVTCLDSDLSDSEKVGLILSNDHDSKAIVVGLDLFRSGIVNKTYGRFIGFNKLLETFNSSTNENFTLELNLIALWFRANKDVFSVEKLYRAHGELATVTEERYNATITKLLTYSLSDGSHIDIVLPENMADTPLAKIV